MRRRLFKIVAGLAVLGGLAFGGVALASGGGGSATGAGADQARAAALAHLGSGTAGAVERDSENGATWEVEVTTTDGKTVAVRLDANYKVIVVEGDSEAGDGPDSDSIQENDSGAGDAADTEEPGAESEVPGDDGPEGHADEPGNPNAGHEVEGNE